MKNDFVTSTFLRVCALVLSFACVITCLSACNDGSETDTTVFTDTSSPAVSQEYDISVEETMPSTDTAADESTTPSDTTASVGTEDITTVPSETIPETAPITTTPSTSAPETKPVTTTAPTSPPSNEDQKPAENVDANGYIKISTKQELNAIRNNLSGKYILTSDITFTAADFAKGGDFYNNGAGWLPIGNTEHSFSGIIDGDGHTVKGLKLNIKEDGTYCMGFIYLINNGTVKDLKILDANITVTSTRNASVGIIAGRIDSGSISNCHSSGTVNAKVSSTSDIFQFEAAAGGIAGYNYAGEITNCRNSATVYAEAGSSLVTARAGGIVGTNYGKISKCNSTGVISTKGNSEAGGIAGFDHGEISDCQNSGNVRADSIKTQNTYAGGIAGRSAGKLNGCSNTGNVTATGLSKAGGIVGYGNDGKISSCFNLGTISAECSADEDDASAGGIIGASEHSEIFSCYNKGNVTVKGRYAGGIAGSHYNYQSQASIYNCYNTGTITLGYAGYPNAGGIVGMNNSPISYCYNIGTVTVTSGDWINKGGIIGQNGPSPENSPKITDCYYLNSIDKGIGNSTSEENGTVSVTSDQLSKQSTFAGFDFSNTWVISGGRPQLKEMLEK